MEDVDPLAGLISSLIMLGDIEEGADLPGLMFASSQISIILIFAARITQNSSIVWCSLIQHLFLISVLRPRGLYYWGHIIMIIIIIITTTTIIIITASVIIHTLHKIHSAIKSHWWLPNKIGSPCNDVAQCYDWLKCVDRSRADCLCFVTINGIQSEARCWRTCFILWDHNVTWQTDTDVVIHDISSSWDNLGD